MSQNIFKNPYIVNPPVLGGSSVGNGTLVVNKLTHFTVAQEYTAVCTAVDPFTVFKIVGSLDGSVGAASVGTEFFDEDRKVFLTIQQGPTTFEMGDLFTFSVDNGTDLNEENLNTYDELPQKNFGTGIIGQAVGDENVRYVSSSSNASAKIGDLKFDSLILGSEGSLTRIIFEPGSIEAKAEIEEQGLKLISRDIGSSGNLINILFHDTILAESSFLETQNIRFDSKSSGTFSNGLNITFLEDVTESILVNSLDIVITVVANVTTVDDVIALIIGDIDADVLISASSLLTGSENVFADTVKYLTGGSDSVGQNGEEVVVVNGNDIILYSSSDEFTLQESKDLIDASVEATALVEIIVTGVPTDNIVSIASPVYLIGGLDDYASPGNEIITVYEQEIKYAFVPDYYTSDQLKTLLLGSPEIAALVGISILDDGTTLQDADFDGHLTGGFTSTVYSFNKSELTNPDLFHEGNADILVKDLIAQGEVFLSKDVSIGENLLVNGVVSIKKSLNVSIDGYFGQDLTVERNTAIGNDLVVGNDSAVGRNSSIGNDLSVWNDLNVKRDVLVERNEKILGELSLEGTGDNVANVQTMLNDLKDLGKMLFYTDGHEKVEWDINQLVIPTNLNIEFPETNYKNIIEATTLTIVDGEHVYVTIDKESDAVLTTSQGLVMPRGQFVVRLVSRVGDVLVWADNSWQDDGKKIRIGEGGSGALAYQEKIGLGDGVNTTFNLTFYPTSGMSILVFANTVQFNTEDWVFNEIQNTIVFNTAPESGVEVFVFYMTEGDTLIAPSPSGTEVVNYHDVTASEETATSLTLSVTPVNPANVKVDIIGGTSQRYAIDFTVSGNSLNWAGLRSVGLITEGTELRICYFS